MSAATIVTSRVSKPWPAAFEKGRLLGSAQTRSIGRPPAQEPSSSKAARALAKRMLSLRGFEAAHQEEERGGEVPGAARHPHDQPGELLVLGRRQSFRSHSER